LQRKEFDKFMKCCCQSEEPTEFKLAELCQNRTIFMRIVILIMIGSIN